MVMEDLGRGKMRLLLLEGSSYSSSVFEIVSRQPKEKRSLRPSQLAGRFASGEIGGCAQRFRVGRAGTPISQQRPLNHTGLAQTSKRVANRAHSETLCRKLCDRHVT